MRIVIDIPEEYRDLYETEKCKSKFDSLATNEFGYVLRKAFENGTPLPKGHGDLKDADKLKNAFIKWSMAVQGNFTDAYIASIVCNSPTVIEADKEGEQ